MKKAKFKRPHNICIHSYEMCRMDKSIEEEIDQRLPGAGGGRMGSDYSWAQSLFWSNKNVPEVDR